MQMSRFSQAAQKVLIDSQEIAKTYQNQKLEPEHLAMSLLKTPLLKALLNKKNIELKQLENNLALLIKNLPKGLMEMPTFSVRLVIILSASEAISLSKGQELIEISDLFLSLIENKDKIGSLGTFISGYFLSENRNIETIENKPIKSNELNIINDSTENLNLFIKNKKIGPIFERNNEIQKLIQILSRKNKNNPLLIGEPGVGRSSIVYGFITKLIKQDVPAHLISKEVLSLELSNLMAGTTLRGQLEEKTKNLLSALKQAQGQYILFIRDLGELVEKDNSSLTNMLFPLLNRSEIQIIALATPASFKQKIEKTAFFEKFFESFWINETNFNETLEILRGVREKYEVFHGVFIEDDALKASIELGSKHLSGKVLPSLAIDLIDEACARHRLLIDKAPKNEQFQNEIAIIESLRAIKGELLQIKTESFSILSSKQIDALNLKFKAKEKELFKIKKNKRSINPFVTNEDIAEVISQETSIPVQKMLESEKVKLANMEKILEASVVGQNEAISSVSHAIRRARVGIKDQKKPIGSFLFLGPSGVGKTELARSLTNFLFDDEKAMIRIDMSEFMEKHSVARLIGAPPGYQGAEEGGQLTESVKRKPFSIVLFDEIEKAHVDVLNILLQVLDDGRLTDSKGQLVHFNNCVIIMTSNLGSDILLSDYNDKQKKDLVMKKLLSELRPEFLNRIDEIIFFNPLEKETLKNILDILINNLEKKLLPLGISIKFASEVKEKIVNEGYDKNFGARPLKRLVQKLIENPLAKKLITSNIKKNQEILVKLNNEQIDFIFSH